MQKIKSLIIDDEPVARSIIESYIKQFSTWEPPIACNNAIEAMEVLNGGYKPDVMFLDINMPVINGIDFYKTLPNPPLVVLPTAYKEFAVDAFELQATDYLVKPISFERFLKTIQRIQEKQLPDTPVQTQAASREFIFLKHNGRMQKVNFADISFIEAKGDYINFHTSTGSLLTNMQLKEVEEYLPATTFIRVHRSFIININHVHSTFGNIVVMPSMEIPIGVNYKEAFLKMLQ
jgi:DNA-binding LytR/AlgR family response regulator